MLTRLAFAAPLFLALTACGATLTRGPAGWHESPAPYSITPLADGALFPAGWTLDGYATLKDGFRRGDEQSSLVDLKLKRTEDDGTVMITNNTLEDEDSAKRPEVLAERWIDHIVRNPKSDDDSVERFAPVVPKLETTSTATMTMSLRTVSETQLRGRTVQIDSQEPFTIAGGEGAEVTATLAPIGGAPDRRLYLAVVRQTGQKRYAVVAYGNTPGMFDKGLTDAQSFAHRIRF